MLRWKYDSIIGAALYCNDECSEEVMIYGGENCLAVMPYEVKYDNGITVERLLTYFDDEKHLKEQLGVGKGCENNFFYKSDLKMFRLNTEHRDTPTFVKCLAQAKWENGITIELVNWNDVSKEAKE